MEKTEEELTWEKENDIIIDYVQQSDAEEAKEFLYENCYKDEPLSKSFIKDFNGWFDRRLLKEIDQFLIYQPIGNIQKMFFSISRGPKCTELSISFLNPLV